MSVDQQKKTINFISTLSFVDKFMGTSVEDFEQIDKSFKPLCK